jgi:phosphoribosyl 1,2-cyclic phosphodiesterase
MTLRYTVLASGSGGNASLIQTEDAGVLLDAGLGSRTLEARLSAAGRSWECIQAVILTHTHTDHWQDSTLQQLHRRGIPLYCHREHHQALAAFSAAFPRLADAGLLRPFEPGEVFAVAPGLRCRAFPVSHDSGATFGFRFEGQPDLFGNCCALAYVADLGTWDEAVLEHLVEVDLLALEFNHDVGLECESGRMPALIARVLGDEGHLSNDQAAALLREVLRRSTPGRLRYLVQLHLSRDCNRRELAAAAAEAVFAEMQQTCAVHTASQVVPSECFQLGEPAGKVRRPRPRAAAPRRPARPKWPGQPELPGLAGE